MSTTTPHASRNRRIKAAVAGAALLATCGLVVGGTQAGFNDRATATVPFTTGSIDLTINGQDAYTVPAAVMADLGPGDTVTDTLVLQNDGASTGTLSLATSGIGAADTAGLEFRVTDSQGNSVTPGWHAVADAPNYDLSTLPNLAGGAAATVQVQVRMAATAPNTLQGQSFNLDLDWTLSQV